MKYLSVSNQVSVIESSFNEAFTHYKLCGVFVV